MRKPLLSLTILAFLTLISCKEKANNYGEVNNNQAPEQRYESEVFNFNYPEDWSITDQEEIETGIHYLAVEKNGFDASGLITVVSFNDLIDLDESIQLNIGELQKNLSLNNLNFEVIKNHSFNGNTARSSKFNFSTMGIKHEGIIYAFSSANNSVVILKQEALEDAKNNSLGFKTIESSFEIK